ncbi:sugar phosphate nucleotidyltransferase [Pedobacter sp. BMA]|uniref:nucleotidyltransferase family protein n=1 Tax=Pedobacter sp. BMA TaxID=1663685 RepID=UPI00064B6A45|nr:sugar phosphate nucleotidyltransferase [Pedobacter sp. BMA]KLT64004.1 nucleotidyltransferase [Pedobacter sp. BMA]
MTRPTLVILAAGMASRYGGNKQTESFGPNGETIMEYSIYDAIKAGFGKVIFIIREEFHKAFAKSMEAKLNGKIELDYVFQSLDSFSNGIQFNQDRVKPFGTAHALLCCKGKVNEPFAVINADDFYGFDAFQQAYQFLTTKIADGKYACLGYALKNTVSEFGAVTRGEIKTNTHNEIVSIKERREIILKDGKIVSLENDHQEILDQDTQVSMNFFCFDPTFINWMEKQYYQFLEENKNELKAEFLIPEVADQMIKSGNAAISVIPTDAKWFGVTFKDDAPIVKEELLKLTHEGVYPEVLWKEALVN